MAKHDGLDRLLTSEKLTADDWKSLKEILDIDIPEEGTKRRENFNEEIRHNYGHTLANIFRKWYEPDYEELVRGTAKKLSINIKDHHSVTEIEDKIIIEVIDMAKEKIIKEKGVSAWQEIEKNVEEEIEKMIERGELPPGAIEELKKARGAALMGALYAGHLAGFALYQVAAQVFFQIAKSLGLRIGVAFAGPLIGGVLSFLLGPAGWLLAGLTLLYDLGNTNWKKTIPSVVSVAIFRRKYQIT